MKYGSGTKTDEHIEAIAYSLLHNETRHKIETIVYRNNPNSYKTKVDNSKTYQPSVTINKRQRRDLGYSGSMGRSDFTNFTMNSKKSLNLCFVLNPLIHLAVYYMGKWCKSRSAGTSLPSDLDLHCSLFGQK
jgi:hypothetical protein